MDSLIGWVPGAAVTNLELSTTRQQGTNSLEIDKDATAQSPVFVTKLLPAAVDVQQLIVSLDDPHLRFRSHHVDFTNIASVAVRLGYRLDGSGIPDIWDEYEIAAPAAGWNALDLRLLAPTAQSGTPSTPELRRQLLALQLRATPTAPGATFINLKFDAIEIRSQGNVRHGAVLIFDGERLQVPPLDSWIRNHKEDASFKQAKDAFQRDFRARDERIRFGLKRARFVGNESDLFRHLEESLRYFSQFVARSKGWGVAYPAHELVDTTLTADTSVRGRTLPLADSTDVEFLGDAGVSLRVGPNLFDEVEMVKVKSRAGLVVTLEQGLKMPHTTGVKVRSAGYYPSLGKISQGPALQETGQAVPFTVEGVEFVL